MTQTALIKKMKAQGFDLKFKQNGNGVFFCAGVAFPQEAPFEDNEKFFAKHIDFIKSLTKADWEKEEIELPVVDVAEDKTYKIS